MKFDGLFMDHQDNEAYNARTKYSTNYSAPGRGTGYCFRAISFFLCFFVYLFVSLSETLREDGCTDLHEIFREGVE